MTCMLFSKVSLEFQADWAMQRILRAPPETGFRSRSRGCEPRATVWSAKILALATPILLSQDSPFGFS